MMNARERRDMEELRAYYQKVQDAIQQMQDSMNKIDMDECRKNGETALMVSATAKGIYMSCIKMLCGE